MATVQVFTAARSLAIEQQAIVGGSVSGGILTLQRQNGTTFPAGSVVGPAGPTGPPGPVTTAQLNSAITAASDDNGRGLVAMDEYPTLQTLGLSANTFIDVTGMAFAFAPVAGRKYMFVAGLLVSSIDVAANFDIRFLEGSANGIAYGSVYAPDSGKSYGVSCQRVLNYSGTGTLNYKLQVRTTVASTCEVRNNTVPAYMAIIDLGA